jgi:hypothetical protein
MSTKTTFKRIALVAVAALGLGVLTSVAPATAAANTNFNCTTAYTTGAANTTDPDAACTSVAGPANFVTVTATTLSVYVVLTGGTFTDGTTTKTITTTANIATPTVGTITAAGYPITNGVASSTAQTVTVTVGATANKGLVNAATSTSLLKSGTSWASITADETVYAARTNAAVAGVSKVVLAGANGAITSTTAVTATISGPGSLQLVGSDESTVIASGRAVSSTFGTTTGTFFVRVLGDGVAGTATVTITAGAYSTTETVVFYGAVASLTATVVNKQIPLSVATTGAVTVVAKDSLGQVVPGVTPVVTTATAASIASGTCSASTATAASSCDITAGATAGSSVLTFTDGSITTTATVAAAARPTAVALAFDKSEYQAGEAFVLTLTASNSAGVPADKAYATLLAGALTTSQSLTVTLFGASVTIKDGVATAKGFMPLAAGPVTVSGTTGTDAYATGATAGVAISATTTVVSDGAAQAAADAAAEATDAANAATDAANAAAEAADAATAAAQDAADAVAALSTQVAEMVDALKKQITALTNLVIKIQKKVKA